MAEITEDRVKETSISTGSGDIVVNGAMKAFRPFSQWCNPGDTFYGCIQAVDSFGNPSGDWEVGHYTYSAANTISRTTILASSNANSPVNFSAGVKQVFIDFTAFQIKQLQSTTTTPTAPSGGGSGTPSTGGANPVPTVPSALQTLYTGLIFADEFNTGSTLNTAVWNGYNRPADGPDDTVNYDVSGGNARIWPLVNGSGRIFQRLFDTSGNIDFLYGFFECEVKMSYGAGCWPAFWLYANDEHEIDIFEAYSGGDTGTPWGDANLHPVNAEGTVWVNGNDKRFSMRIYDAMGSCPDLSAAFHKFGMHWDATKIIFYFDGVEYARYNHNGAMNVRMYLLIDLLMGSSSGDPAVGTPTQQLSAPSQSNRWTPQGPSNATLFNYVRVWGLK
jgi:hypothetical protein